MKVALLPKISRCLALVGILPLFQFEVSAQSPVAPRATPSSLFPPRPSATPKSSLPARGSALPGAFTEQTQPPREVPLVEKKFDELSNTKVGDDGKTALAIAPEKWKHAETENFILHYRRVTEAQKVAREVEYDLWFVATTLGAKKEQYSRKSHVYVFEDEEEWKTFLGKTDAPAWSASFAFGDELFLNVRRANDTGRFNSSTLAHETTHAVIARIYRGKRWPLWLNEGFAEYMGGASIATRKGQSLKRYQTALSRADLPLPVLEQMQEYPQGELAVSTLYQTSERFVRFLMTDLPKDRISKFIDAILEPKPMQAAVMEVYGDKLKDWADFEKRYERFGK